MPQKAPQINEVPSVVLSSCDETVAGDGAEVAAAATQAVQEQLALAEDLYRW